MGGVGWCGQEKNRNKTKPRRFRYEAKTVSSTFAEIAPSARTYGLVWAMTPQQAVVPYARRLETSKTRQHVGLAVEEALPGG
jgi:hypothetical protein